MRILEFHELVTAKVQKQYKKVVSYLKEGNFSSVDLKKLNGTPFYRVKLDDTNRLLLQFSKYQEETVLLVLEVILNHNYAQSRFLRGKRFLEEDFRQVDDTSDLGTSSPLRYINEQTPLFHLLEKVISFDEAQQQLYLAPLPLILVGSAGSGKTALTLEKIKTLDGRILYTSLSPFLTENARALTYSNGYVNERSQIDFLSFNELLETIAIPKGKEINYQAFKYWAATQTLKRLDQRKLFEEFKGVLTGQAVASEYLSEKEYLELGVKQSIFLQEDRQEVYRLFRSYLNMLDKGEYYDSSVLATRYLPSVKATYDYVVVDEVQDLTVAQLSLILRTLKVPTNFMLVGDANQIVHPNFFSWSRVKSFISINQAERAPADIINVLRTNFRNGAEVTRISNRLLRLKQKRFGSIDKESNFLVEPASDLQGEVSLYGATVDNLREINEKTRMSKDFAVVVPTDELKASASLHFDTPLLFSVHEAKGLEYKHVILYGFVSYADEEYRNICSGVSEEELRDTIEYRRAKDKNDKSLESYKFYTNILYVGLTRAVESVFVVDREDALSHPLYKLLEIKKSDKDVFIAGEESTKEEWEKEARRLQLQGKEEQADLIRERILKIEPVPWKVTTLETIVEKIRSGFSSKPHKKVQLELYELSLATNLPHVGVQLARQGYAFASRPKDGGEYLRGKYLQDYAPGTIKNLEPKLRRHGVDFKDQFGYTPLMNASRLFKDEIVEALIERGADPSLSGPTGLNCYRLVLLGLLLAEKLSEKDLRRALRVIELVTPSHEKVECEGKMHKLDPRYAEFLFLNVLLVSMLHIAPEIYSIRGVGFTKDTLIGLLDKLPDEIVPERRRRGEYVNGILAKNEASSPDQFSRRLFMRTKRGYYILNPRLQIWSEGKWHQCYDFIGFSTAEGGVVRSTCSPLADFIRYNRRLEELNVTTEERASSVVIT